MRIERTSLLKIPINDPNVVIQSSESHPHSDHTARTSGIHFLPPAAKLLLGLPSWRRSLQRKRAASNGGRGIEPATASGTDQRHTAGHREGYSEAFREIAPSDKRGGAHDIPTGLANHQYDLHVNASSARSPSNKAMVAEHVHRLREEEMWTTPARPSSNTAATVSHLAVQNGSATK